MSKNILGQTFGSVSIDLTTSNISADKLTGTTEINGTYLTANRGLTTDSNKKLVSTTATATEINHLSGVSSNIQTQLNAKQPEINSGARLNANLINDGSVSNNEFNTLDGIDTSQTIKTQLDAKLSSATATLVYFTNIAAQGKQNLIDSSNRLNANLIGDGSISNTEFGYLNNLSGNIQLALNGKEPSIENQDGMRLPANNVGTGQVNDNELATLSDIDTSQTVQTQLNGKQATIGNGDLTIARTSGLQDALNAKQDTLNLTNIIFNNRGSSFFPNRTVSTPTKLAVDGGFMCRSIINHGQSGDNPSFITFGTRFTAQNNKISLGTNGNTRLFIADDGRTIIGADDTNGSPPPESTGSSDIYAVQIAARNVNGNANGLYISTFRQKNIIRLAYPLATNPITFQYLDIETPNSSTNVIDDFILKSDNRFRCRINNANVFRCDTSPAGQFTVFNFNNSSDDRIKSNETPITNALESIMKLKPYTYDKYNDMEKTGTPYKESGLISQDIWYNAPELRHLVSLGKYFETDETLEANENGEKMQKEVNLIPTDIDNHEELNDTDFNVSNGWSDQEPSSVKYLGLIAYLIKAVQELKVEIDTLKNI